MRTRRSNFGIFLQSMALTLALLLAMAAAAAFFVRQRQQQAELRQAAAGQSGVPVESSAQAVYRLLLAVQGEEPEFLLLRADAPAAAVTLCAVPGQALVQAPAGITTLAACYEAAGPARAAELLAATVGAAPQHYFAATAATWAELLPPDLAVELDVRPFLPASAREALGVGEAGTWQLTPSGVEPFLQSARAAAGPQPALRAQLWAALLRAAPSALESIVPNARKASARTLTDLSAGDLHGLEEAFSYLAGRDALTVDYDALPTTAAQGGERLTPEAVARAATLLS